jgi:hypothetical protein
LEVDEAVVDRLYALPPEEFTAVRNALAKELTQAGDRNAAAEVKALRKPTVVVWALNQVARSRRDEVERLLAAGAELRRTQERALDGDARGLRDSRHAVDESVRVLARAAARALDAAGRGSTGAEAQLVNTLRAAALDEEVARLLSSGRLAQAAEPPAFPTGMSESAGSVEAAADPHSPDGGELREARRRLHQVEAEVERASKQVERLVHAGQRARQQADDAEAAARTAEERLSTLRLDADEAASRLKELERRSG